MRLTAAVGGSENCYDGNEWTDVCTSNEDCAESCAVEGADYEGTYGVSTSGDALTLNFVTDHQYGTNVGSRMYLLETPDSYQMFDLPGNEFTFDVDLSTVPCGMNSALYFVAMEADGGMSSFPVNEAGAAYGTGYCDAQCARDLKFVGGLGNYEGWEPSSSDSSAGVGALGACCAEIDVWESNSHSFALTPHACEIGFNDYHVCGDDDECGGTYSEDRYAGRCDANGCDYNPYRMGNPDFYGEGKTLDTSQPFTVVTQFESDNLHQFFIQGGQQIEIPVPTHAGLPESSDINPALCDVLFDVFTEDTDRYADVGGWPAMEEALAQPHVLVMSIWADVSAAYPYCEALALTSHSTTPTCSGSTASGPATATSPSQATSVVTVPPTLASPTRLFPTTPTREYPCPTLDPKMRKGRRLTDLSAATSPGPTSASAPLVPPLALKRFTPGADVESSREKGRVYRPAMVGTVFVYIFARFFGMWTLSTSRGS